MKLSRRGFIGTAAGAAAGAATSKGLLLGASQLTALTSEPLYPPRGPERFATSLCGECAAGCGTQVRLIGERAVYVGGNPFHPLNRGGVCPRGLAGLQAHYHPDRLTAPRKRAGESASGEFTTVGWEEALAAIAAQLAELRREGKPHRLGIIYENGGNTLSHMIARFLTAFGSPNDLGIHPLPAALRAAWWITQGHDGGIGFDLERSRLILSFGANLLEGWGSPGFQLRAFGSFRRDRDDDRGRLIQIEPRLSVTGSKADEWVAIRPGTEGVFALGLAHVLLTERLYDRSFVETHVYGFERWRQSDGSERPGFREWVLENYPLSRVSEETEVPAGTLLRIARSLPRNAPAVAIAGRAAALSGSGVGICWAIHALNALLGSVDREGGVLVPLEVPYTIDQPPRPDAVAAAGLRRPRIGSTGEGRIIPEITPSPLADLVAASDDAEPPLDVLLVVECDPVALSPAPERIRKILDRIPLVVMLGGHLNETTRHAHLLLPTPSGLERWDDAATPPLVPFTVCGLRHPVVKSSGETRHPGDVIIALAHMLGDVVAEAFPWVNYLSALRENLNGLFTAQRGDVFGSVLEERWARLMQRAGWWSPSYRSAEDLWTRMQERGGWWDPYYYQGEWRRVLNTPSRRFDLSPRFTISGRSSTPGDSDSDPYPLILYPFEVLFLKHGGFIDMPTARSLMGPHFDGPMEGWVEVHPDVAERSDLREGDRVRVESVHGAVEARLKIYDGLHPTLAAMPLGMGRTVGRWTAGWGANPLALVDGEAVPTTGEPAEYGTCVRITRI